MKKILAVAAMMFVTMPNAFAAVTSVSCSSDEVFAQNACSQCFSGGSVNIGEYRGELYDTWENSGDTDQLLYKEEQQMPFMMSLGGASWGEVKASDSIEFWTYSDNFESLYDEANFGYVLPAGSSVTWIESSMGSAYKLTENTAPAGDNIGLLAYDIAVHNFESGIIDSDTQSHRECVLFTSGTPGEAPVVPVTPTLPQTGPEHILLAIVALMLGLGFIKMRK